MATVRKSLRVDAALAERISSAKLEDESENATYQRILSIGLERLDEKRPQSTPQTEAGADNMDATPRANDLLLMIELLKEQLATKDAQLIQAQTLADQAQKLQARTLQALPEARLSLSKRLRAWFRGN